MMTMQPKRQGKSIKAGIMIAAIAASLPVLFCRPAAAQQPRAPKLLPLSALTAQGFEIKAVTSQSGVPGTLVLQKDKDVYLCSSREIAIQPSEFECWPVK